MLKFAKYFFIVFLITAVLPLVIMFLWNNSQMQRIQSLMIKTGMTNGIAKLEQNLNNNLVIQEGEIQKKIYFIPKTPRNINSIKSVLKQYTVEIANEDVLQPASFYEEYNKALRSCTILPVEHNPQSIKICKPINLQEIRPAGPYNIGVRFDKEEKNVLPENMATDPMSTQIYDRTAMIFEQIFNLKPIPQNSIYELKNNDGKIISYIDVSISIRPNRLYIDNIITGLFILIVGIVSSFVIGLIINRIFVLPVMALSNATKEIKKGNFKFRLTTQSNQELIQNIYNSFNDMTQNLEAKENLRQSFISNLTHDLRTPLVSQAQSLELISQKFKEIGLVSEYELAQSLAKNNEHLLKMVNLILESYSFDSKNFALNIENVDIYNIIEGCEEKLKPLIKDKKIEFLNNIYKGGTTIEGDKFQLTRVFMNILSNAIDNTKENDCIKINAHYDDKNVVITVEDNGNGIAAEDLKFIFDRYYSGKSLERKLGSGFGLSVCKKLIEMHHGTEEKIMKILIVEDYLHTRKTTAYALKTKIPDVMITEADNGLEAINSVKSGNKPDVILMDISMPVMNGIDAALHIKNLLPDTKIIMLTSFSEKHLVLSSFKSGANAYCLKNIHPNELVNVIYSVLNGAIWIDPSIANFILEIMQSANENVLSEKHSAYDFDLTAREKDILKLVAEGKSNKEIADELILSIHTVKNHLKNILQKLCVEDRTQAAILAIKENLV